MKYNSPISREFSNICHWVYGFPSHIGWHWRVPSWRIRVPRRLWDEVQNRLPLGLSLSSLRLKDELLPSTFRRGNTKLAENPEHLSHWGAEMMDVSLIYGDLSNRKWGRSWDIMWTRKVVFSPKKFHTPAFGHLAYETQLNRGCQACLVVFGRSYNSKIVRWNH